MDWTSSMCDVKGLGGLGGGDTLGLLAQDLLLLELEPMIIRELLRLNLRGVFIRLLGGVGVNSDGVVVLVHPCKSRRHTRSS
jgi:hypothetical protein